MITLNCRVLINSIKVSFYVCALILSIYDSVFITVFIFIAVIVVIAVVMWRTGRLSSARESLRNRWSSYFSRNSSSREDRYQEGPEVDRRLDSNSKHNQFTVSVSVRMMIICFHPSSYFLTSPPSKQSCNRNSIGIWYLEIKNDKQGYIVYYFPECHREIRGEMKINDWSMTRGMTGFKQFICFQKLQ